MSTASKFTMFVLMILVSDVTAQNEHGNFREWFAKNGRSTVGILESFDLDRADPIVRIRKRDANIIEFSLNKLCDADQAFVRLQQINAEDRTQFELVADHIEALRTTPRSVAGILQQIAKDQNRSPYADVWSCIAYAAGDNDQEKAISACRAAIKRIKEQRNLDASRHARTLSAAYNNLGICYIKQRDGDSAAKQFVSALNELDYVPPILSHNISHLLEMKDKPGGLRLEHGSVVALQRALAGRRVLEPKKKMQLGWYYSLDLDVPQGLESELSVAGILSPDPTLELIGSGTGIVVAPGYVLTVRSAVTHPDRSAFLTTVGVPLDPVAGNAKYEDAKRSRSAQWKQLPARRVIVTLPEKKTVGGTDSIALTTTDWNESLFSSTESNSSTDGVESGTIRAGVGRDFLFGQSEGSDRTKTRSDSRTNRTETGVMNRRAVANSTNYVVIHPKQGPEEELAVLQVDGLRTRHLAFSTSEAATNDLFQIASFDRGPDMVRNGLKVAKGNILGQGTLTSELMASIPFSGGQRGAALHDSSFRAIGLAIDTKTGKDGIALSAASIRAWFEQNVKAASLTFADDAEPKRSMTDIVTATVPIFVWGKRSDTELEDPLYNQFFNDDNLIEMHVLRDQYCITCRGKGHVQCIMCKGQGDVQNGFKQIAAGVDPRTGRPILLNVPNMVACPTCNTGKRHLCPICRGSGENPGGPTP
jgi:hypothetical protein